MQERQRESRSLVPSGARADLQHPGGRPFDAPRPRRHSRPARLRPRSGHRCADRSRRRRDPGPLGRGLWRRLRGAHPRCAHCRRRPDRARTDPLRSRARRQAVDRPHLCIPARLLGACAHERPLARGLRHAGRAALRAGSVLRPVPGHGPCRRHRLRPRQPVPDAADDRRLRGGVGAHGRGGLVHVRAAGLAPRRAPRRRCTSARGRRSRWCCATAAS